MVLMKMRKSSITQSRHGDGAAALSISNLNCRSPRAADVIYEGSSVCPCQLGRMQFHLSLQGRADLWS